MENIKIKDKNLRMRFNMIYSKYKDKLDSEYLNLIKIIILRYKENSYSEDYIIFILLYELYFFKVIDIDNEFLSKNDKKEIIDFDKTLCSEYNLDIKNFVVGMMRLNEHLFSIKIIIKYTLLNSENKYLKVVPDADKYFKSIGYIIPILTLKNSKYLSFYQDFYFKKVYPNEYVNIKNKHLKETSKLELPGEYIISIINNLNNLMLYSDLSGVLNLRKKSYFSLYSKYERKKEGNITDSIGIKIVFPSLNSLKKFKTTFEGNHFCIKKKNYILHPKSNGYKAVHYSYVTTFRNSEILVELQIQTKEMNTYVQCNDILSHFNYTITQNKWHPLFKEVYEGYEVLKEYLDTNQTSLFS